MLRPLLPADRDSIFFYLLALLVPCGVGLLAMGLGRAKNAAHTMTLALLTLPVSLLAFTILGFGFMCGGAEPAGGPNRWLLAPHGWGLLGGRGFFLVGLAAPALTLFLANAVRIGAAAAVMIGATAERWRINAFACFTALAAAILFPIGGCWVWGGGWIARLGGVDAGGSCVIHLQAGVVALMAAALIGARSGKYDPRGQPRPMVGHDLPLALLGNAIVAFGLLGLNLIGATSPDTVVVVINSILAAAAGALVAALLTGWMYTRPDPSLVGNGLLAGIIAVAAGCRIDTPWVAIFTGAIASCLIVPSVLLLERRRLDDPVGAISMHGIGGLWGTLAVGLFAGSAHQLWVQAIMVVAVGGWAAIATLACFVAVKFWLGANRVAPAVEAAGLDVPQLGVAAYPEFLNPMSSSAAQARTMEPRPALLPTPTLGRHRYSVLVDGVEPANLIAAWSALCQVRNTPPPPEFNAVYPFLTTVNGTRFRFNGGDPAVVRASLLKLLETALVSHTLTTRLET